MMNAIAVDGPAGSGKSTVARQIATSLDFLYVDTGAMYRAVAWKAMQAGIPLDDEEQMGALAEESSIEFDATGTRILIDGKDVSAEIRTPEVTANTKYAARAPRVRKCLVAMQQQMGRVRPVVMEGRDVTTIILADAKWKFFLSADPQERARRRMAEFEASGHAVDFDALVEEIRRRDESDMAIGPLAEAYQNALAGKNNTRLLDTTTMSPDDVVAHIVNIVRGEMA